MINAHNIICERCINKIKKSPLVKTKFVCDKCKENFSTKLSIDKKGNFFLKFLCKCGCNLFKSNGGISFISADDFNPMHKLHNLTENTPEKVNNKTIVKVKE